MLTSCSDCKQVVEISALRTHLLTECDHRSKYRACDNCGDVVQATDLQVHRASDLCASAARGSALTQCPLCHVHVGDGDHEEEWRSHLVTHGCTANPRS